MGVNSRWSLSGPVQDALHHSPNECWKQVLALCDPPQDQASKENLGTDGKFSIGCLFERFKEVIKVLKSSDKWIVMDQ